MYLSNLHVENLRNLQSVEVALSAGFNYFHGLNGAGKTALLEAVHLLFRGRSFRTHRGSHLIAHGENGLLIRGSLQLEGRSSLIGLSKDRSGQSQLKQDGEKMHRVSDIARLLPIQTILPNSSELIFGAPSVRRSFIDWGLFHVERQFLDISRSYQRALSQRNAYLRQNTPSSPIEGDPWVEQLVEYGAQIENWRSNYVGQLGQILSRLSGELALPPINAVYRGVEGENKAQVLAKKMSENWLRDVKLGATHAGPHRANLAFETVGGHAADVLSRGQAKLLSCACILAQVEHLHLSTSIGSEGLDLSDGSQSNLGQSGKSLSIRKQSCLVLIDDFGAELDKVKWVKFVETLQKLGCQVIANSTEPMDLALVPKGSENNLTGEMSHSETRLFHVEQGRIQANDA